MVLLTRLRPGCVFFATWLVVLPLVGTDLPGVARAQGETRLERGPVPLPPSRQRDLLPAGPAAGASTATGIGLSKPAPEATPAPTTESACMRALRAVHGDRIKASDAKPPTDPGCQVVDPVLVNALSLRVEGGAGQVAFDPPATIGCAMARRVSEWLDTSVQPLAQGHFERDVTGLRVGGGHECRRRNRSAGGPLSEHATGLALDIFSFQLGPPKAGGVAVVVEKPAGLVQSRFLDAVRQSACGAFMTALGPGADAAHANHLHVDIQERRSAASRFCQ